MLTSQNKSPKAKKVAVSVDDTKLCPRSLVAQELRKHFGANANITHVTFGQKKLNADDRFQAGEDAIAMANEMRQNSPIAVAAAHMKHYKNAMYTDKVEVRVSVGSEAVTGMAGTFAKALKVAVHGVNCKIREASS